MSTLKVNNIDAYSNDGGQAIRIKSSLIIGGNTGSFAQDLVALLKVTDLKHKV